MPFVFNAIEMTSGMLMLSGCANQMFMNGNDHPNVAKDSSTNIFPFQLFFPFYIFYSYLDHLFLHGLDLVLLLTIS